MQQLKNLFKSLFCYGLREKYFYFCTAYTYCTIFLKQMILKYLRQTVFILLSAFLLSACLNSESRDLEYSKDAQIYSFSMSAVKDTMRYLSDTKFSIDQLSGKIFNQDSLPYLFNLDSVDIDISGHLNQGFSGIVVYLDNDSNYLWNGKDSLAFKRLKSIETTAPDGKAKLKYDISINIHQNDPYIFTWNLMAENYLPTAAEEQKTIAHSNKFYTYYKTDGQIRASVAESSDAATWSSVVVSGLPTNVKVNSFTAISHESSSVIYVITQDGELYESVDGLVWQKNNIGYPVKSIYGALPLISGQSAILVAVDDSGILKFGTTYDFSDVELWNNLSQDIPTDGFSAVSLDNPTVFAAKYIILYGGADQSGNSNNKVWIIQEKDGLITAISKNPEIDILSGELFFYDKKVYMMGFDGTENILYSSSNYGLNWVTGGESQILPEEFKLRDGSTVLTDSDNFIWIFGGKSTNNTQIMDVWRGRLNKLAK